MGFLDKAKAAATDLAAKADTALGSAGLGGPGAASSGGDAERYFRDLGVVAYLESTGRPVGPGDRERVTAALRELEQRGSLRSFTLHTATPPPPGSAGGSAFPPPPAGATPPPPPCAGGSDSS
ncbi:hypothetical protein [Cellulomonas fimi]|uniref:hypothetical protein n=1 Tax=Cellulomonas fimi TaxID=1708 RepID=UPI001B88344A|nr:hypothetical protein [Cellulomonas fimi]